tara:strand:- start:46 stop:834 length:789 start_codon:yes stop_codon:yes gene_type:complete
MVKLEDYTIGELKKMISSFNKIVKFAGYSKLKKTELIKMIRTHPKIKVQEGSNAVKLSIKTDEDFEKQTKVKKEKVKKEVKKEVEKLDDVKVVVQKAEPLTITKADGNKIELKMKPKKKEPKKVLSYENAWAEGNFNSSQRTLIAQMTDERRKEVLQILGLKKQKAPKKEDSQDDKEKEVDNLLKQIKKSYEKNKPKLHKMTDTKYKDIFFNKLVELYDGVEDIYQEDLTTEKRINLRKRFSAIIPFKKEQKKKKQKKEKKK